MLKHSGDGFSNGGTSSRDGPPITASGANFTIDERIADGVHVALCNREGGFAVASIARARLLVAIDGVVAEGRYSARRLLLQAARALR